LCAQKVKGSPEVRRLAARPLSATYWILPETLRSGEPLSQIFPRLGQFCWHTPISPSFVGNSGRFDHRRPRHNSAKARFTPQPSFVGISGRFNHRRPRHNSAKARFTPQQEANSPAARTSMRNYSPVDPKVPTVHHFGIRDAPIASGLPVTRPHADCPSQSSLRIEDFSPGSHDFFTPRAWPRGAPAPLQKLPRNVVGISGRSTIVDGDTRSTPSATSSPPPRAHSPRSPYPVCIQQRRNQQIPLMGIGNC
jgi:hypothetical protein